MKPIFAIGDAPTAGRYLVRQWGLISYAYWGTSWLRGIDKVLPQLTGLVLDSGAFTIWQRELRGQAPPGGLNVETYARWLVEVAPSHNWALSLDVIGNGRASMAQYQQLRALVGNKSNLVPVWHEGDDLDLLDSYVASAPLVALGRTDGRRNKRKSFEFYDEAFNRFPEGKFHALGNSDPETLEPYPFESFDSTGWQRNAIYSEKHGWPWNRASKDTRIKAYVEAVCTISHRPAKQLSLWRSA